MKKHIYTNEQIVNDVCSKIKEFPSKLSERRNQENDFLELFAGKTNAEIAGILTVEPHTTNLFMAVLYDRVVQLALIENLTTTSLFEFFRSDDLVGGLYWSHVVTDISTSVENYADTNSPIGNWVPRIAECYSDTPVRRDIPITFATDELQTAFNKPSGVSDILTSLLKKARDLINIEINGAIVDEIMAYTAPSFDNFKFVNIGSIATIPMGIDPFDVQASPTLANIYIQPVLNSTPDTVESNVWTKDSYGDMGLRLATLLKLYASYMATPSTAYNIGDANGAFTSSIPLGEGVLVINNAYATLMNLSEMIFFKSGEWKSYFKEIIYINDTALSNATYSLVAGIFDPNAIEWKFLLDKTLTFENARALYVNYFVHYWYATLINPFVNGLLLVAGL